MLTYYFIWLLYVCLLFMRMPKVFLLMRFTMIMPAPTSMRASKLPDQREQIWMDGRFLDTMEVMVKFIKLKTSHPQPFLINKMDMARFGLQYPVCKTARRMESH